MELIKDLDHIVNFAAESHVDRSILDPGPFFSTNIEEQGRFLKLAGIAILKNLCIFLLMRFMANLGKLVSSLKVCLCCQIPHIQLPRPVADLVIRAYQKTYGLHVTTARPSNNYGYFQYPEKFIPLMITNLLENKPVPVYGEGNNIRDWIFFEDTCAGIRCYP